MSSQLTICHSCLSPLDRHKSLTPNTKPTPCSNSIQAIFQSRVAQLGESLIGPKSPTLALNPFGTLTIETPPSTPKNDTLENGDTQTITSTMYIEMHKGLLGFQCKSVEDIDSCPFQIFLKNGGYELISKNVSGRLRLIAKLIEPNETFTETDDLIKGLLPKEAAILAELARLITQEAMKTYGMNTDPHTAKKAILKALRTLVPVEGQEAIEKKESNQADKASSSSLMGRKEPLNVLNSFFDYAGMPFIIKNKELIDKIAEAIKNKQEELLLAILCGSSEKDAQTKRPPPLNTENLGEHTSIKQKQASSGASCSISIQEVLRASLYIGDNKTLLNTSPLTSALDKKDYEAALVLLQCDEAISLLKTLDNCLMEAEEGDVFDDQKLEQLQDYIYNESDPVYDQAITILRNHFDSRLSRKDTIKLKEMCKAFSTILMDSFNAQEIDEKRLSGGFNLIEAFKTMGIDPDADLLEEPKYNNKKEIEESSVAAFIQHIRPNEYHLQNSGLERNEKLLEEDQQRHYIIRESIKNLSNFTLTLESSYIEETITGLNEISQMSDDSAIKTKIEVLITSLNAIVAERFRKDSNSSDSSTDQLPPTETPRFSPAFSGLSKLSGSPQAEPSPNKKMSKKLGPALSSPSSSSQTGSSTSVANAFSKITKEMHRCIQKKLWPNTLDELNKIKSENLNERVKNELIALSKHFDDESGTNPLFQRVSETFKRYGIKEGALLEDVIYSFNYIQTVKRGALDAANYISEYHENPALHATLLGRFDIALALLNWNLSLEFIEEIIKEKKPISNLLNAKRVALLSKKYSDIYNAKEKGNLLKNVLIMRNLLSNPSPALNLLCEWFKKNTFFIPSLQLKEIPSEPIWKTNPQILNSVFSLDQRITRWLEIPDTELGLEAIRDFEDKGNDGRKIKRYMNKPQHVLSCQRKAHIAPGIEGILQYKEWKNIFWKEDKYYKGDEYKGQTYTFNCHQISGNTKLKGTFELTIDGNTIYHSHFNQNMGDEKRIESPSSDKGKRKIPSPVDHKGEQMNECGMARFQLVEGKIIVTFHGDPNITHYYVILPLNTH